MAIDLDEIFGGARVPAWLRSFAADPADALSDLLVGRAALGHLSAAEPVDLLLGWLEGSGDRSDLAAQVDESLAATCQTRAASLGG